MSVALQVLELITVVLILLVDAWVLVLTIRADERASKEPPLRLPFRGKTRKL